MTYKMHLESEEKDRKGISFIPQIPSCRMATVSNGLILGGTALGLGPEMRDS